MAQSVLFLVHGMGDHGPGWATAENGPVSVLDRVKEAYPRIGGQALTDLVEFVEVRYDHIFERIFAHWQEQGEMLDGAVASSPEVLDDVASWMAEDTPEGFARTHVADVALYFFFRAYRQRIRIEVIDQIVGRVNEVLEATDEDVGFMVLAHSLGTMVVHDALHIMATETWAGATGPPPEPNPFRASSFNLSSIFTMGNVTDIIHTEYSPYGSVVRPGTVSSDKTNCQRYFNFRHELDPFTFPRAFEPIGFGTGYFDVPVRHFRQPNVHGLDHYLAHPRVHIPILNAACGRTVVTQEEFIEAVKPESFPQWAGDFGTSNPDWGGELETLRLRIGEDPGVLEWLKSLKEFYDLARELTDSLGGGD